MRNVAALIGDRENPLEANFEGDLDRTSPEVGDRAEVSPVGNGDALPFRGKTGKITGVFKKFGKTVGYEVALKGTRITGTCKDFYVGSCNVLEDVQPPTATSVAVCAALGHWNQPRTYWGPMIDGLENLCFELAGVVQFLTVNVRSEGWSFYIQEPMGTCTVVDCSVRFHDNYWTLMTAVYPLRSSAPTGDGFVVLGSPDHWTRTYLWAGFVAKHFPTWENAVSDLRERASVTQGLVQPYFLKLLPEVLNAHEELIGAPQNVTKISVGVSRVRLKPGTLAMTEAPSDRRPYTVITLAPRAVSPKNDVFHHSILHELIHYAVANRGGEPHNKNFHLLAEALGLKPEYRN